MVALGAAQKLALSEFFWQLRLVYTLRSDSSHAAEFGEVPGALCMKLGSYSFLPVAVSNFFLTSNFLLEDE